MISYRSYFVVTILLNKCWNMAGNKIHHCGEKNIDTLIKKL